MNNDLEKKLAVLREEYKKNLPAKITEIQSIINQLKSEFSSDSVVLLHRKVHSLHGSAKTYGYINLGETAARFENYLNQIKSNNQITPSEFTKIENFINDLDVQSKNEATTAPINHTAASANNDNKTIFVLDDKKIWDENLNKQILTFGYQISLFQTRTHLIESIAKSKPSIIIINIDMLNSELEKTISDINIPILFISISGEFKLRLKAVQLKGKGFFVKPLITEELIKSLDFILKAESEVYRILIVDDEPEVANYHAILLSNANMKSHIITKASEIESALNTFKPDLILVDIYMPECSGTELAAIIRQQRAYENIPIIFLSSEEDEFKQLSAMKLGADDFIKKSTKPEHFILAIRNRAARYKTLSSLLVKDSLTGTYNHSFMLHQLKVEISNAVRHYRSVSIAIIDLDNFKRINDRYGHLTGDQVLRSLSIMLQSRLRASDFVGRYGGEEFLIILTNTDADMALSLIDGLREEFISLNFTSNNQLFNMTFSAGVASFPPSTKADELINAANIALNKAKNNGRNRVEK